MFDIYIKDVNVIRMTNIETQFTYRTNTDTWVGIMTVSAKKRLNTGVVSLYDPILNSLFLMHRGNML